VREVWRQRAHVGRQQTATGLSLHNIIVRKTGGRLRATRRHEWTLEACGRRLPAPAPVLAGTSRLAGLPGLGQQSNAWAKLVPQRRQPPPAAAQLQTVEGSGPLLAQTMVLATGARRRCPTVGHDAADGRGVQRTNSSHGKRQGQGNVKKGHPSLAWASLEAAPCAVRCSPTGPRCSQRQQAQRPLLVARKAVAHPLARACDDRMRALVPLQVHKAFG
jgi:Transposase IS116/IS110/IS902 family